MTRKKLNLAYITNESLRKSTFTKRKKGFFKKIHELSVLCGIDACAVIYSPFSSTPEVWPSNSEVRNVLEKFENVPEIEQEKKMVNHESFLRQNITKTRENNIKKMKDNTERAMKEAMFHFLRGKGHMFHLTDKHRDDLCRYIDQYLKELYHQKSQMLNQPHLEYGESSSAANAVTQPAAAIAEVGSSSSNPNHDAFNTAQLLDELWAPRPITFESQKPEQVDTFENHYHVAPSDQQGYFQMMNPVSAYHQHPNVAEDGMYNQTQNQNNQMCYPMLEDNNRYYHHQS